MGSTFFFTLALLLTTFFFTMLFAVGFFLPSDFFETAFFLLAFFAVDFITTFFLAGEFFVAFFFDMLVFAFAFATVSTSYRVRSKFEINPTLPVNLGEHSPQRNAHINHFRLRTQSLTRIDLWGK